MAFLFNPKNGEKNNFIIHEKNIFLNKDGTLPSFSKILEIRKIYKEGLFFSERENNLCVINLPLQLDELNNNATNKINEDENIKKSFKQDENTSTSKKEKSVFFDLKEISIREYFASHSEEENSLAARAASLSFWISSLRFCPHCGKKTIEPHKKLSALFCSSCSKEYFPRIEPCVIVLVHKDDKVLLARHTYRNQDIFACIAGFMESGESAENAVRREVLEETGIQIKNILYKGSQSWPFPDQLMLAFTAEYESGTLKPQKEEIAELKWLKKSECKGPKPGSVAWRLINDKF